MHSNLYTVLLWLQPCTPGVPSELFHSSESSLPSLALGQCYHQLPPSALETVQCVLIIYLNFVHPVTPYGYTKIHLGIYDE